jgi:hypothetical protein
VDFAHPCLVSTGSAYAAAPGDQVALGWAVWEVTGEGYRVCFKIFSTRIAWGACTGTMSGAILVNLAEPGYRWRVIEGVSIDATAFFASMRYCVAFMVAAIKTGASVSWSGPASYT